MNDIKNTNDFLPSTIMAIGIADITAIANIPPHANPAPEKK